MSAFSSTAKAPFGISRTNTSGVTVGLKFIQENPNDGDHPIEYEFFSATDAYTSGMMDATLLRMLAGFETPTSGRIVLDGAPAMIAGGVESISGIRSRDDGNSGMDPWIQQHKPDLYMAMIDTADIVARRYNISREAQDRFSVESQRKTAEAQAAGRFADEIVPCTTVMAVTDKETGVVSQREVTGSITLDLTAAQEVTLMGNVRDATLTSLGFVHGTVTGRKLLVFMPYVQLINPQKVDVQGKRLISFDFRAVPSAGNDELRIVTSF